jgi:DNA-binding transcriptional ArsR family regulator
MLALAAALGTSEQNRSKHLGTLQRAGVVARRKQGNFSYYSIADEGVFVLCETVCGSLQQQLESLRGVVAGARE